MSTRRVTVDFASFVWSVERTRCPVRAAFTAASRESASRISPIITTSGSCRRSDLSAFEKLTLSAESTSACATPGISYSMGSSTVMMLSGSPFSNSWMAA